MRFGPFPRPALLAAAVAGLAACDPGALSVTPPPVPRAAMAAPEPQIAAASAETIAARIYYERVEQNYLDQGLLRVDENPRDAPFTARDLAANFLRIAFYDEFSERAGRLVANSPESRLRRWQGPMRVEVIFGASVPPDQRSTDRAEVTRYVTRLSGLTGLPARTGSRRPNHSVLILNADERKAAAPMLATLAPGISRAAIRSVTGMAPDIYCTVFGVGPGNSATYSRAVTVIRGELPDRMRRACIHEELAQSLGLVADYPRARPSIFNDNEEFALLTQQDQLMVRMLYDPRLWPGMSQAEARPIVRAIAEELMGGDG